MHKSLTEIDKQRHDLNTQEDKINLEEKQAWTRLKAVNTISMLATELAQLHSREEITKILNDATTIVASLITHGDTEMGKAVLHTFEEMV